MSDQYIGPPVIIVLHVMGEGGLDVEIGGDAIGGDRLAGHHRAQGGQRDLSVHRRIGPADLAKAGELGRDDAVFLVIGDHVGIRCQVIRHGRIDIEAINTRVCGSLKGLDTHAAIGLDDCGVEIDRAGVLPAGPAQPAAVGVIVGCRIARRLGEQRGARHHQCCDQHRVSPLQYPVSVRLGVGVVQACSVSNRGFSSVLTILPLALRGRVSPEKRMRTGVLKMARR